MYMLANDKAIQYHLSNQQGGWQLSVNFPKRITTRDRLTVLRWLHDYEHNVKTQHPHWLTALRHHQDGYVLHILRNDDARSLIKAVNLVNQGDAIKDCWSGTLDYAR
jgi:hypothetical protein